MFNANFPDPGSRHTVTKRRTSPRSAASSRPVSAAQDADQFYRRLSGTTQGIADRVPSVGEDNDSDLSRPGSRLLRTLSRERTWAGSAPRRPRTGGRVVSREGSAQDRGQNKEDKRREEVENNREEKKDADKTERSFTTSQHYADNNIGNWGIPS